MPQIAQIKEIDGEVWVRVGVPGDFLSGITLWTPEEVEAVKRDLQYVIKEKNAALTPQRSKKSRPDGIICFVGCSAAYHGSTRRPFR